MTPCGTGLAEHEHNRLWSAGSPWGNTVLVLTFKAQLCEAFGSAMAVALHTATLCDGLHQAKHAAGALMGIMKVLLPRAPFPPQLKKKPS